MEESFGAHLAYIYWVGKILATHQWNHNFAVSYQADKIFRVRYIQWAEMINLVKNRERLISALGLNLKDIPPATQTTGDLQRTLLLLMAGYKRYQGNWLQKSGSSSSST